MGSYEFTFAVDDILARRGDFLRDIRSVSGAKGHIIECSKKNEENIEKINAKLWMPNFSGDRYSIMTVAALFDSNYDMDIIIVPEFKLSFYYRWGGADFNTEKVMLIMDELCKAKSADPELYEWVYISVAAAVCAVYEHVGRLSFIKPKSDIAYECLDVLDGFDFI